jgi:hypothetical protein
MTYKRTITEEKFMDTLTYAFESSHHVDLTNYFEFIGFRDFLRFTWSCFNRKKKWTDPKIGRKTAEDLMNQKLEEARIEVHQQYKKTIFGLYRKTN